jgi:hypothetical protein
VQEVPPGPPDQVRRLERYRQEHPDVDIEPPGARSTVWRAFRDGDLIAYGFTLMVFLERLEALPEPLGAAEDFGRRSWRLVSLSCRKTRPTFRPERKYPLAALPPLRHRYCVGRLSRTRGFSAAMRSPSATLSSASSQKNVRTQLL